jgi:hypothetical protein
MIYLFSSSSRGLYVQDVLDACCYPEEHVMRLRYSESYVSDAVKRSPALMLGETGLFVFADLDSSSAADATAVETEPKGLSKDFRFFPIREIQIVDVRLIADALLVDVKLGRFLNYGPETEVGKENEWNKEIKALPERPCPPGSPDEGYFFYLHAGPPINYSTKEKRDQLSWRSVIERINHSSLREAVTFRIIGFYRVGRWRDRIKAFLGQQAARLAKSIYEDNGWREKAAEFLASFGRVAEAKISPVVKGADCMYRFGMGELILLKLLFYRSRSAPMVGGTLTVRADKQAFTSTSKDQIRVQFRYNEERVFLLCNRITDPVLSSVGILQEETDQKRPPTPQPLFTIRVNPSRVFLGLTLVSFGVGLLFLNLTPQDATSGLNTAISFLSAHSGLNWAAMILTKLSWLANFPRVIGTMLVIYASWRYLRKFPLK